MRFEWDPNKSRANLRKHGVSFETASLVFDDPNHLSIQDRFEEGELEARGLSPHALALALRLPASRISQIVCGQRAITPETAAARPIFWRLRRDLAAAAGRL